MRVKQNKGKRGRDTQRQTDGQETTVSTAGEEGGRVRVRQPF